MRINNIFISGLLLSAGLLSSCDKPQQVNQDLYDRGSFDQKKVQHGRQLFLKNCMVCHGFNAEGAPGWRKRDKDGRLPPPPLNGTGHTWHHSKSVLMDTIKHGTARLGGTMPAWKDKLSDGDIEAIIMWFQSQWPDQLYQAWVERDKNSKQTR